MPVIDLKADVTRALDIEWESFARRHPRLAEFINRELLVERATEDLSKTPEFQEAMDRATRIGTGLETAQKMIAAVVGRIVKELVP